MTLEATSTSGKNGLLKVSMRRCRVSFAGCAIDQSDVGEECGALVSLALVFGKRGNIAGFHTVDCIEQRSALAVAATVFEELEKVPQHLAEAHP